MVTGTTIDTLRSSISFARPAWSEALRDVQRKTRRVRVGNVRRDGHDDSVLGERHERRDHAAQRLAVVADRPRSFTRQRNGLDVPAQTVARLLARGHSLRRLE